MWDGGVGGVSGWQVWDCGVLWVLSGVCGEFVMGDCLCLGGRVFMRRLFYIKSKY